MSFVSRAIGWCGRNGRQVVFSYSDGTDDSRGPWQCLAMVDGDALPYETAIQFPSGHGRSAEEAAQDMLKKMSASLALASEGIEEP